MATINLRIPKGYQGWGGYNRIVSSVTKKHGNGADFIGEDIPNGEDYEAEVGEIVVRCTSISAIINEWTLGVVTELDDVVWVEQITSEKFADFRDMVIYALSRRQSNRIVDHFEGLERNEQINLLRRLAETMACQCEEQGDEHGTEIGDQISTILSREER